MRRLLSRLRSRIRNERGSAAAAVVFTVFTTLTLTAISSAVVSSLVMTSASSNQTAANSNASVLFERYLDSLAKQAPAPAQTCTGAFCAQVTGTSDIDGVRHVTIENLIAGKPSATEVRTLRSVTGTMVTGLDARGNPVWSAGKDSVPHQFSSIVSTASHSCALDTAKAAWCWGSNSDGQLGDGTTTNRNAPVKVQTTKTFNSLTGASGTTCGLDDLGKAWCWGDNTSGQLGTGAGSVGTDALTPVAPTGGQTFTAMVQSANTTCAIDTAKAAWCWGANPGNGTSSSSPTPVKVVGSHEFSALSLDTAVACGLDATGKAWCWSAASNPLVSVIPTTGTPVEVTGGRTYTELHVARQTNPVQPTVICALDTAKASWCWGENSDGQLGNNSTTDSLIPVQATGSHKFQSLAVSPTNVCGLSDTSYLWCWGDNTNGQVGNGTTTDASNPVAVDAGRTYKNVRTAPGAGRFFCATSSQSTVHCWGKNDFGQAAPGSTTDVKTPTAVPGLANVKGTSAGISFACSSGARLDVICWGRNDAGQAGAGSTSTPLVPGPGVRKEYAPTVFSGFVKGGK